MIGEIIANYEVKSLLGAGGMGTVYLAEHVKLGRQVAIKSLHAQFVNSEEIRARFIHEAKVMAQLQHPNIVTLYDYVETEIGLFLIIELVDGKPIDDYIEQVSGPIEENSAVQLMTEILEGFQYAHEKGLVHRDIKPSNLVISTKNKVKILDFGIAKLVGDTSSKMTKTGTHIGTVYYMSPEQVKGDELDQRSDIYALGVTFFQMLTGSSPYKGITKEFDVFMKIVNEELPDPRTIYPGVSEHMCTVIQKATAKDANERFQSCDEFVAALKDGFTAKKEQIKATTEKEDFQALENHEELNTVTASLADEATAQFSGNTKAKKPITKVADNTIDADLKPKKPASKNQLYAIIGCCVGLLGLIIYLMVYFSTNSSEFKNDETEKEVVNLVSEKDKLSYVLGAMNAKTIVGTQDPNIDRLDMAEIAKGFSENMNNNKPDDCEATLTQLFGPNFQNFDSTYAKQGAQCLGKLTAYAFYQDMKQMKSLEMIDLKMVNIGFRHGLLKKDKLISEENKQKMFQDFSKTCNVKNGKIMMNQAEKISGAQVFDNGIVLQVISEGKGGSPSATDDVKVEYILTSATGDTVQSSYEMKKQKGTKDAVALKLDGGVIPGWTYVVPKMKKGGKYRVYIPWQLAYGEQMGRESLCFVIELVDYAKAGGFVKP